MAFTQDGTFTATPPCATGTRCSSTATANPPSNGFTATPHLRGRSHPSHLHRPHLDRITTSTVTSSNPHPPSSRTHFSTSTPKPRPITEPADPTPKPHPGQTRARPRSEVDPNQKTDPTEDRPNQKTTRTRRPTRTSKTDRTRDRPEPETTRARWRHSPGSKTDPVLNAGRRPGLKEARKPQASDAAYLAGKAATKTRVAIATRDTHY